jgi:curli biogenesis system outer membrane secretion channel CsgG
MALFVLMTTLASMASAQDKKRVAVFDFDYATVKDSASAVFGNNMDVGKGIADLLVESLVKSGVYSVIERKALDKILAEQNFSNSDRADANTAAKLGKILGVDAIIIGSITQFGRDDSGTKVSGGALGRLGGGLGIGGVSRNESKAVVAFTARVVSADTAEILGIASGKGESKRTGTSLLGAGGNSKAIGGGNVDMKSGNFANTIIGEAVYQAVQTGSQQLDSNSAKIVGKKISVEGLVADVSDQTLILNVGTKGGVRVGDRLQIKRTTREIADPATGKIIRRVEDTVGEVVISEADEGSSVGKFSGTGKVQVGDRVVSAP